MFVRIATHQARIGMFIDRVEGVWLDNPFWGRRFRIRDATDLKLLQDSPVDTIMIDLSKGIGPSIKKKVPFSGAGDAQSFARFDEVEVREATATLSRTTDAMRDLFSDIGVGKGVSGEVASTVVDDIGVAVKERPRVFLNMVRLREMDNFSYRHSIGVCALAMHFARLLKLDDKTIGDLAISALLHDIGKIAIPPEILGKSGELTPHELEIMRTHPYRGIELLAKETSLSPMVSEVCLNHHERIDGRGYPRGLIDIELSLPVRIISICDVFDALTSIRPYKNAWSARQALDQMTKWHGQFDPALLKHFTASIRALSRKD